jgi:hypothetical protein
VETGSFRLELDHHLSTSIFIDDASLEWQNSLRFTILPILSPLYSRANSRIYNNFYSDLVNRVGNSLILAHGRHPSGASFKRELQSGL